MTTTDLVHSVSALCSAAAEHAFAFVADPARLGEWALGCWGAVEASDGIVKGASLFDGQSTFVRTVPDPGRLTVDFEVGADRTALVRRISARVVPGRELDLPDSTSLVVLTAWRVASMDEDRWRRLVVAHEAEILMLRHRIESSA